MSESHKESLEVANTQSYLTLPQLLFKDFTRNPKTRGQGFFEMTFLLGVVTVGYVYLWRKGTRSTGTSTKCESVH